MLIYYSKLFDFHPRISSPKAPTALQKSTKWTRKPSIFVLLLELLSSFLRNKQYKFSFCLFLPKLVAGNSSHTYAPVRSRVSRQIIFIYTLSHSKNIRKQHYKPFHTPLRVQIQSRVNRRTLRLIYFV